MKQPLISLWVWSNKVSPQIVLVYYGTSHRASSIYAWSHITGRYKCCNKHLGFKTLWNLLIR